MSRTAAFVVLAILTSTLWPGSATSAEEMLDLIPDDAAAGIAVRSIEGVEKSLDKLARDSGLDGPGGNKFLAAYLKGLDMMAGIDRKAPAAVVPADLRVVFADLKKAGVAKLGINGLFVAVVPYSDLDGIGSNFKLQPGTLKANELVESEGMAFFVKGKYLFVGPSAAAVQSVARGKPLGQKIDPARRKTLSDADAVVYSGTRAWGPYWDFLVTSVKQIVPKLNDPQHQRAGQLVLEALETIQFAVAAVRLDGGIGINLTAVLSQDAAAEKFLKSLGGLERRGVSDLIGLPKTDVLAAYAVKGDATLNVDVARGLIEVLLMAAVSGGKSLFNQSPDASNPVARQIRGNRAALYYTGREGRVAPNQANAPLPMALVLVVDTDKPQTFLNEMRKAARQANIAAAARAGKGSAGKCLIGC
jgi:hypothetical protein